MGRRERAGSHRDDVLTLERGDAGRGDTINTQVRIFYEHFPCGGDSAADDDRWDRLPWMNDEFAPQKSTGKWVLDVGCGIGIDMQRFLEGGGVTVGVDFAASPLAHARRRLGGRYPESPWHLVRADARFLPFREETFDIFYSNGVLHHIADYEKVLRESHRCLKPGGRGTVLVYHKRSIMTWLTQLIRRSRSGKQNASSAPFLPALNRTQATRAGYEEVVRHPLIQYFSRDALAEALRAAGFDVGPVTAYDWAFPLRRRTGVKAGLLDRWLGRFLVSRLTKGYREVEAG